MNDWVGRTVSHFKILERLGGGGMGEVYLAQDTTLGRLVALKFISESIQDNPVAADRFMREARAVAALNHPHICAIYETGEFERQPFLAMEYLKGKTLRDEITAQPLAPADVTNIALQLADALSEAHTKGILHRDLKPENVFLVKKRTVKLLDFGLAKSFGASANATDATTITEDRTLEMPAPARPDLPTITQVGALVGTLRYMSPEQLRGERLDARSDLFSLGIVLYEAIIGKAPFAGTMAHEVCLSILNETPPPPRSLRGDVPEPLSKLIDQLLEKDPDRRFESAAKLSDALMGATPSAPSNVVAEGPAVALPSLGVKRSSLHVWVFTVGFIAILEWLLLTMVFKRSPSGVVGWMGLGGAICIAISPVVWGLSLMRRQREGAARVVRLQAPPDSRGRIRLTWWAVVSFTVLSSLGLVFLVIVWLLPTSGPAKTAPPTAPSLIPLVIAYVPVTVLFWTILLRSRGWRHGTRTRWHRTMDLEVNGTYPQVLACCSHAMSAVGARVTGLDLDRGLIDARTPVSLLNWGERLTFRVQRSGAERCSIALESDCLNPVILSDFGKNAANLRKIAETMVV